MRVRLTLQASDGQDRDVVVTIPPARPLVEVIETLRGAVRASPDHVIRVDGLPLTGDAPELAFYDGVIVSFVDPASEAASPTPSHGPRLVVVQGTAVDQHFAIGPGGATVGRTGGGADISLDDPEVSNRHCRIAPGLDGLSISDLGSTNGTWLNGVALTSVVTGRNGDRITVGKTTLEVDLPEQMRAAALSPDGNGGLILHRQPREAPTFSASVVELPAPGAPPMQRGFPWVGTVVPLVLAVGMAALTRHPEFLLFALLTPVTAAANLWNDKRTVARAEREREAAHAQKLAEAQSRIDQALVVESTYLRLRYPSLRVLRHTVGARGARLWERRRGDADALAIRLGSATVNASVELRPAALSAAAPHLAAAPVGVTLGEIGVLGLVGAAPFASPVLRSFVLQIAAWNAASDVHMYVLGRDDRDDVAFSRWLPHVWDANSGRVRLGLDESTRASLVAELAEMLQARLAESPQASRSTRALRPVVVLLLGAGDLRRDPEIARLLRLGPELGLYFLSWDIDPALVPEEAGAVLSVTGSRATLSGPTFRQGLVLDVEGVDREEAELLARRLAPLRLVDGDVGDAVLPDLVPLARLVGLDAMDPGRLSSLWAAVPDGTTRAAVGADAAGPVFVDLAEMGPHALIAGATGSGKSELLVTLIASLALNNAPDSLALLFIDFKGGSTFGRLLDLPHTVGLLTNLDRSSVTRALTSLQAELTSRQALFQRHGVSDHSTYRAKRAIDRDLPAVPALVLVVDEFAEMRSQIPDCMDELVRIARIGRSLGVHLVLATQIPRVAITAEIRGNTRLKMCLRMETAEDSHDVLESSLAYRLPARPKGRAYLKSGDGSPRLFQVAIVTLASGEDVQGTQVTTWDWRSVGASVQMEHKVRTEPDVERLVHLVQSAAQLGAWPAPRAVLLDELPEVVALDDLARPDPSAGPVIGLRDRPDLQSQDPFPLPIYAGSLAIVGSNPQWRTTALRTAAVSMAQDHSADELHIHTVDGGRGLSVLAGLPHLGTAVRADDEAGVTQLLHVLLSEIDRRKDALTRAGFGDVDEQWRRAPVAERLPRIVVLVDQFEVLAPSTSAMPGPSHELLLRLLSSGQSAGVTVLAAGSEVLLRGTYLSRFSERLFLRLNNENDAHGAGLRRAREVTALGPGRGIWSADESSIQIAVLGDDPDASQQSDAAARIGRALMEAAVSIPSSRRAYRRVELPGRVRLSDLPSSPGIGVGVGGDQSLPLSMSRTDLPLCIVGPPGSGRTSAARSCAVQLAGLGFSVRAVAGTGSTVPWVESSGVEMVDPEGWALDQWQALLHDDTAALVIDDIDGPAITDALREALTSTGRGAAVVVSSLAYVLVPPPLRSLLGVGSVLLLAPEDIAQARALGIAVDRTALTPGIPGRGFLRIGGQMSTVQVAVAE